MKRGDNSLSSNQCQAFLINRADEILDLLKQDLLTDIRSLHLLRKQLKSVLYSQPFIEKSSVLHSFLKSRKKWIKSVESGSLHDLDFFLRDMGKTEFSENSGELNKMENIKQDWQQQMQSLKEGLQKIFPEIVQFARGLKEK